MDAVKMILWALLAFSLVSLQTAQSEKMTLDRLGQKMDDLGDKINRFLDSVGKIDTMLEALVEKYTLNDLILKCVSAIGTRNEIGANKIWRRIQIKDESNSSAKATRILDSIILDSYGGKRESILPLIRFISQTKLCTGYETLFNEMQDYGHLYNGGEIFSLASSLLRNCKNMTLFHKIPEPVQLIFTHPVSLQNTFNKGYLFRKPNLNDLVMENQVASIKSNNNTDFWVFEPTSEFAENFHIKNEDEHLIASQSRRLYFSNDNLSKFLLEMNRKSEISIGVSLDDRFGKPIFYRLYVQNQKKSSNEVHEVNLWTINPKDEHYKFIYWNVGAKPEA